ncbi:LOW QUALITY PROTEIN: hypothetical protein TorRG33x02_323410 [Trema orientale]|uniref:Uncharacterized protein n=1 Tax=Trema orientale TaxID=63057 RepID=A0A2P5BF53_TREOI|nr:LOW QUALITY PROTEIN: hypothetical protein TorRG33x02_323410 [Trema orientale]
MTLNFSECGFHSLSHAVPPHISSPDRQRHTLQQVQRRRTTQSHSPVGDHHLPGRSSPLKHRTGIQCCFPLSHSLNYVDHDQWLSASPWTS